MEWRMTVTEAQQRMVFRKFIFYKPLVGLDDWDMVLLFCIDQARDCVQNFLERKLMPSSLFKEKVKSVCKALYNPKGNSYNPNAHLVGKIYKGHTLRIQNDMMRNTSEEDWLRFSEIVGEIDSALNEEYAYLRIVCRKEVRRHEVSNADLVAEGLYTILKVQTMKNIVANMEDKSRNAKFALCIDPSSAEAVKNAYVLDKRDIVLLFNGMKRVLDWMTKGDNFEIPLTDDMTEATTMIVKKIVNPRVVYGAALEAGLDLTKTSHDSPYQREAIEYLKMKKNGI